MKKKLALILILVLFLGLIAAAGNAESTGIVTLQQAVKAAQALASQADTSQGGTGENSNTTEVTSMNAVALNVAGVVIDLDFAHKKYDYLEVRQESLKVKAEKSDMDFKTGKIDAKTRDEIKKAVLQNNFDLSFYKLQIENGEKSFKSLTGADISEDFNYDSAYLITDAGKLKLPASGAKDKNGADTDKKLSAALDAYGKLGNLISAYIDSGEKLSTVRKDFKTGKAEPEAVEVATDEKEKAGIDALEGKANYSKLLYELDCSLQGYISRDIKKLPDPIFQASQG